MMASLVIISCSRDQLNSESLVCEEAIIYDDVREVIFETCGTSGCHDGITEANYNNFAGIETILDNGRFSERTLVIRDMPPNYATVGPKFLSEEQLNLLQCWEQNGFSEF